MAHCAHDFRHLEVEKGRGKSFKTTKHTDNNTKQRNGPKTNKQPKHQKLTDRGYRISDSLAVFFLFPTFRLLSFFSLFVVSMEKDKLSQYIARKRINI